MAKDVAEAFVKRYGGDEEFRNKVNGLDSPDAIRAFLDEEGLGQFTRQELESARTSGELSDAELEAVAGGAWGVFMDSKCDQVTPWGVCEAKLCTSVW